jgi:simple sugar transport system ATP-binding protein
VGAIEYLHRRIVDERDEGRGILLVSLELDEILSLSDRILVMYEGEIVGEHDGTDASEDEIGMEMLGAKREDAA